MSLVESSNSTKVVHFIKGSNFVPLILRYGQVSETTWITSCFSKDRITLLSGYAIGKKTIIRTRTKGHKHKCMHVIKYIHGKVHFAIPMQ